MARGSDRVFNMIGFAVFSGLLMAVVMIWVLFADDMTMRLAVLGVAAVIAVFDIFLIKFLKKQRQGDLSMLASDGATVLVVDQYGVNVGDAVIPRERITAVIYRALPAEGHAARPEARTYEAVIGLDQISTLRSGGPAITPRPGSGGEAGSLRFPFSHFLSRENLAPFLDAVRQISRDFFPVTEIAPGAWSAMQRELGESRADIKAAAQRHRARD